MDNQYKEKIYRTTAEEKQNHWDIAVGLQAVDNLKPSDYMKNLIQQNVEGKVSYTEIEKSLRSYYKQRQEDVLSNGEKECDFVSTRISKYLESDTFVLNPAKLKTIHRSLFNEILPDAGEYKKVELYKAEPILAGRSVNYCKPTEIEDYLINDFYIEKKKSYVNKTIEQVIEEMTDFISGIWQIHPFSEGNTRTVAVFAIEYLRSLGIEIDNTPFKENSKFFRDALVRSCYSDREHDISYDKSYLVEFFENVLNGGNNVLDSCRLDVSSKFNDKNRASFDEQIATVKAHCDEETYEKKDSILKGLPKLTKSEPKQGLER